MFLRIRQIILVCYMALIALFSLMPGDAVPQTHVWDKLQHSAGYAVMTLLLFMACTSKKQFLKGLPLIFAYSMGIEVAQTFTPDRVFELRDGLANAVGILIGYGCYILLEKTPIKIHG